MSTEHRVWPGVDDSQIAKDLRKSLGITVSEWLRLSWEDRGQLIVDFKREEGIRI